MTAALRHIRRDFLDDVVIISSNEIQDGTGSGQPMLEVIAAGTLRAQSAAAAAASHGEPAAASQRMGGRRAKASGAAAQVSAPIEGAVQTQTLSAARAAAAASYGAGESGNRLLEEINSLKAELFNINTRLSAPLREQSEADPFEKSLLENGVDREVLDWARQQTGARGRDLERAMQSLIPDNRPMVFSGEAPRIMAFAGPTGVGKTTTLAKIAARFALEENKSVALITIDTYRTGATDQLAIYAKLIGIPLEIASKPQELRQAIGKHLDKQLILIDTAGRSHHNRRQMQELQEFIGQIPGVAVSLVLNASIRYDDLKDVTNSYEPLGIDNCIITKTDETLKYGNLLNIAVVVEKPIPFITNGQRVPEDIRQMRKTELVDAIVGRSALLA